MAFSRIYPAYVADAGDQVPRPARGRAGEGEGSGLLEQIPARHRKKRCDQCDPRDYADLPVQMKKPEIASCQRTGRMEHSTKAPMPSADLRRQFVLFDIQCSCDSKGHDPADQSDPDLRG